jgi:hypothetical protein
MLSSRVREKDVTWHTVSGIPNFAEDIVVKILPLRVGFGKLRIAFCHSVA